MESKEWSEWSQRSRVYGVAWPGNAKARCSVLGSLTLVKINQGPSGDSSGGSPFCSLACLGRFTGNPTSQGLKSASTGLAQKLTQTQPQMR